MFAKATSGPSINILIKLRSILVPVNPVSDELKLNHENGVLSRITKEYITIFIQMPTVAKKFRNIDKKWLKIMDRAADQKNALKCCKDDTLWLKANIGGTKTG